MTTPPDKIDHLTDATNNLASRLRIRRAWWRFGAFVLVALTVIVFTVVRIVGYVDCSTDRTKALSGPANDRVSYLLDGFLATVSVSKLRPAARAADLVVLNEALKRYPLLLVKGTTTRDLTDTQIAAYTDVVLALDANNNYQDALREHPVCSIWWG